MRAPQDAFPVPQISHLSAQARRVAFSAAGWWCLAGPRDIAHGSWHYAELLQESVMKSQAFWASYKGDRSLVGILRVGVPAVGYAVRR